MSDNISHQDQIVLIDPFSVTKFANVRDVSEARVKNLVEEIRKHGVLPEFPVTGYFEDDGKIAIVNGAHRITALMRAISKNFVPRGTKI